MTTPTLNPVDLLVHAGPVVQAVLAILAVMSIWSWMVILRGVLGLNRLQRAVRTTRGGKVHRHVAPLVSAASQEHGIGISGESVSERHGRVAAVMRRRVHEIVDQDQKGVGSLAVISSVSPFVGLFGTVWGIMTSFLGIAAAKDTSLAVVAPGIAEALAATAFGLAVAIPAAFAYNRLAMGFSTCSRKLSRWCDDHADLLSRSPTRE